jgi:hypothetical protein
MFQIELTEREEELLRAATQGDGRIVIERADSPTPELRIDQRRFPASESASSEERALYMAALEGLHSKSLLCDDDPGASQPPMKVLRVVEAGFIMAREEAWIP